MVSLFEISQCLGVLFRQFVNLRLQKVVAMVMFCLFISNLSALLICVDRLPVQVVKVMDVLKCE